MSKCRYNHWIDDYLLGKLDAVRQKEFEEHYFNCLSCFDKVVSRDEIIGILKGDASVFASELGTTGATRKTAWPRQIIAMLSPGQWALAGAATTLLIAVLTIIPLFRGSSPQFIMTGEETVRGASLALISPVDGIKAVPAEFRWQALGENVEYQISIYDEGLFWKISTKESRIILPEDVKVRMTAGRTYSWQVKAFSSEGTLIAVSSRVQFTITR